MFRSVASLWLLMVAGAATHAQELDPTGPSPPAFTIAPGDALAQDVEAAAKLARTAPEQSRPAFVALLAEAQRQNRPDIVVRVHLALGGLERQKHRIEASVAELERAVAESHDLPDRDLHARALSALGVMLAYQGTFDRSLDLQRHALAIHEELGDVPGTIYDLLNVASTFLRRRDFGTALTYFERTLARIVDSGDITHLGRALGGIALMKLTLDDPETAIGFANGAIARYESTQDVGGTAYALTTRGRALIALRRYDAGFADLDRAEAIAQRHNIASIRVSVRRQRGLAWLARASALEGDAREYALAQAERDTRTALDLATQLNFPRWRASTQWHLADVLLTRGDRDASARQIEIARRDEQSLGPASDGASDAIARIRYEHQLAEAALRDLHERNAHLSAAIGDARTRFWISAGFAVVALTALLAAFALAREQGLETERLRQRNADLTTALSAAERRAAAVTSLTTDRLMALIGTDLPNLLGGLHEQSQRLLAANLWNTRAADALSAIARESARMLARTSGILGQCSGTANQPG